MSDTLIVNGSGDELKVDAVNLLFYDFATDTITPSELLGVTMTVLLQHPNPHQQPQIVLIT